MTQIGRLHSASSESLCEIAFLGQPLNTRYPVSDNATALTHTDTQTLVQIRANCTDNTETHTRPAGSAMGRLGRNQQGELCLLSVGWSRMQKGRCR